MTEPDSTDPASVSQRLLGCSPSRTLYARRLGDGREVLVKVYESGSPAEASHEFEIGRRLAGPGIAAHLEVGVDQDSGRPTLLQELLPGGDLRTRLDDEGPLSPLDAVRITRAIAVILARLGATRTPEAPLGYLHGDVKPGNTIVGGTADAPTAVLVDLEHVEPIRSHPGTHSGRFTGGTHGFAPAEAYRGATPTPAFDVFGLGATLHQMLVGSPPFAHRGDDAHQIERATRSDTRRRWLLDGVPDQVRSLVEDCLAFEPSARPTIGDVIARLDAWLAGLRGDDHGAASEAARRTALEGRPLSALAGLGRHGDPRWRARLARWSRIVDRLQLPGAPHAGTPIEQVAALLPGTFRALDAVLLRFPLHAGARATRRTATRAAARLPIELPEAVARLKRHARHADALALCDAALRAIRLAGDLPVDAFPVGATPSLAQRDPLRMLDIVRRDVGGAAAEHARIDERIRRAEAAADTKELEAAIDELATQYGGASPVVAAAKDRLHRLEFYLARIAQQATMTDELRAFLAEVNVAADLDAVDVFRRSEGGRAPVRPRALLRALHDLVDEFPALAPRAESAALALARALDGVTERAWQAADEIERLLATPPIPIRPLSAVLARLDRMAQLDALVDLPGHPRTEALDRIEILRTKVDQARAERDRITRGAQEAMDRGHLTTAIYDMARAVDRFASEGVEGPGLGEQFEEAKRRKRELEDALERNHTLAARYGDRAADPSSSPSERISLLHEREQVLSFLCANLGAERTAVYIDDLRGVQLDLLREHAADGERRLAGARTAEERVTIAQRTFDALQHEAPDVGWTPAEVREARTLVRHWLDILEEASAIARDADRSSRRNAPRPWPRSRVIGIAIVLLCATIVATAIWTRRQPTADEPATLLRQALGDPAPISSLADGSIGLDRSLVVGRLREFTRVLRSVSSPELSDAARQAIGAIDAVDRGASDYPRIAESIGALRGPIDEIGEPTLHAVLEAFRRRALRAGFTIAVLREPSAELRRLLAEDAELRLCLSTSDIVALERALAR